MKTSSKTIVELSGVKAPVSKLKIIKNDTEVQGLRKALMRESASLISFYAQIRDQINKLGFFHEYQGESMLHLAR